jgi:kynurenine formamidase
MRIRSFIIAYALVLAILLFADRRPGGSREDRYSHVVDLTDETTATAHGDSKSATRMIAPGTLIPGTWTAGQIPAERLVAPLVVIDVDGTNGSGNAASSGAPQLSLDGISVWEAKHGMIPPGAVVAIRQHHNHKLDRAAQAAIAPLPLNGEAGSFLVNARNTIGLAVENSLNMNADRKLSEQLALRGNYVLENASNFAELPVTGSLIIVAPEKNKKQGEVPVRILAMVR